VGFIKMGNYKEWISYDSNGYKTAMAYDNGQNPENGFLGDTVLSEVDYSNNQLLLRIGSMML
jgi:hypothetical protein